MRAQILRKYCFLVIGVSVLCFVLISTIGSDQIQKSLMNHTGLRLYNEANNIAEGLGEYRISDSESLQKSRTYLDAIATYEEAEIWYLDESGRILLSAGDDDSWEAEETENGKQIDGFDPVRLGTGYYSVGNFFGTFSQDRLSVLLPVTDALNLRGYLAIHVPVSDIVSQKEEVLSVVHRVISLILVIIFAAVLIEKFRFIRPLNRILKGVQEYSVGNLDYNIPVSADDELGQLASTLNYMSDEMNKSAESQRNFISSVSHDFRSPLTSIKGYVEAIMDGTIPREMQDKYLQIVLNETKRLEKMTREILVLNKSGGKNTELHLADFDINQVIRETSALFEGNCRKRHISLELILTGNSLYVSADLEKIQRVLYNLLDNAIKFSRDDSTIRIETTLENGKVGISVRDHGIGIPSDQIPKIWNRFYKIDSSRGKDTSGTGLGLAIVKEFLDAHQQPVTVVSTPGVGTTFSFRLNAGRAPS